MDGYDKEKLKRLADGVGAEGGIIAPPSYFTQVPDRFSRRLDLNVNEKMMFIYIWGYAADKGCAFPGQTLIMKELGLSKPTVIKTLKSLEEKNGIYIVKQFRKLDNGKFSQTANLYILAQVEMKTGEFEEEYLNLQKEIYKDGVRFI